MKPILIDSVSDPASIEKPMARASKTTEESAIAQHDYRREREVFSAGLYFPIKFVVRPDIVKGRVGRFEVWQKLAARCLYAASMLKSRLR